MESNLLDACAHNAAAGPLASSAENDLASSIIELEADTEGAAAAEAAPPMLDALAPGEADIPAAAAAAAVAAPPFLPPPPAGGGNFVNTPHTFLAFGSPALNAGPPKNLAHLGRKKASRLSTAFLASEPNRLCRSVGAPASAAAVVAPAAPSTAAHPTSTATAAAAVTAAAAPFPTAAAAAGGAAAASASPTMAEVRGKFEAAQYAIFRGDPRPAAGASRWGLEGGTGDGPLLEERNAGSPAPSVFEAAADAPPLPALDMVEAPEEAAGMMVAGEAEAAVPPPNPAAGSTDVGQGEEEISRLIVSGSNGAMPVVVDSPGSAVAALQGMVVEEPPAGVDSPFVESSVLRATAAEPTAALAQGVDDSAPPPATALLGSGVVEASIASAVDTTTLLDTVTVAAAAGAAAIDCGSEGCTSSELGVPIPVTSTVMEDGPQPCPGISDTVCSSPTQPPTVMTPPSSRSLEGLPQMMSQPQSTAAVAAATASSAVGNVIDDAAMHEECGDDATAATVVVSSPSPPATSSSDVVVVAGEAAAADTAVFPADVIVTDVAAETSAASTVVNISRVESTAAVASPAPHLSADDAMQLQLSPEEATVVAAAATHPPSPSARARAVSLPTRAQFTPPPSPPPQSRTVVVGEGEEGAPRQPVAAEMTPPPTPLPPRVDASTKGVGAAAATAGAAGEVVVAAVGAAAATPTAAPAGDYHHSVSRLQHGAELYEAEPVAGDLGGAATAPPSAAVSPALLRLSPPSAGYAEASPSAAGGGAGGGGTGDAAAAATAAAAPPVPAAAPRRHKASLHGLHMPKGMTRTANYVVTPTAPTGTGAGAHSGGGDGKVDAEGQVAAEKDDAAAVTLVEAAPAQRRARVALRSLTATPEAGGGSGYKRPQEALLATAPTAGAGPSDSSSTAKRPRTSGGGGGEAGVAPLPGGLDAVSRNIMGELLGGEWRQRLPASSSSTAAPSSFSPSYEDALERGVEDCDEGHGHGLAGGEGGGGDWEGGATAFGGKQGGRGGDEGGDSDGGDGDVADTAAAATAPAVRRPRKAMAMALNPATAAAAAAVIKGGAVARPVAAKR